MKLKERMIDLLVGPLLLIPTVMTVGPLHRWNMPTGAFAEAVITILLWPPVIVSMPITVLFLGNCPGLFDGGPCENTELAIFYVSIALWWALLSVAIGTVIRFLVGKSRR